MSEGETDGTNQICETFADDNVNPQYQNRFNDRIASLYEFDGGGNPVEVVKVTFHSFTATEFKYTVNTTNVNYQLKVEVWG